MTRRTPAISQAELDRIFASAKKSGYPAVRVEWRNRAGEKITVVAGDEASIAAPDDLDRELAEFEAGHGKG